MTAPPTPCTARERFSMSEEVASPQMSEDDGEDGQADGEHPRRPNMSPSDAGGEEEGGQGEGVGVHHPLQVAEARVQRPLDVGERHVHDGDVQQQHERRRADGDQGPPLAVEYGHRRSPHDRVARGRPLADLYQDSLYRKRERVGPVRGPPGRARQAGWVPRGSARPVSPSLNKVVRAMIVGSALTLEIGDRTLLDDASFVVGTARRSGWSDATAWASRRFVSVLVGEAPPPAAPPGGGAGDGHGGVPSPAAGARGPRARRQRLLPCALGAGTRRAR